LNLQPADYKSAALPLSYASLDRQILRHANKSDTLTDSIGVTGYFTIPVWIPSLLANDGTESAFPVCKRIFKPSLAYDVKRQDKNTKGRRITPFRQLLSSCPFGQRLSMGFRLAKQFIEKDRPGHRDIERADFSSHRYRYKIVAFS
jgi:hypothetical protein